MTEKEAIHLLIRTFYTPDKLCLPNVFFGGGECDLLLVSPSGWATEYEVKLSLNDWKADEKKSKWTHEDRKYIGGMYYCVPESLLPSIPPFVPDTTGIITLDTSLRSAKIHRHCSKIKHTKKLPKEMLDKLYKKGYVRYINYLTKEAWQ